MQMGENMQTKRRKERKKQSVWILCEHTHTHDTKSSVVKFRCRKGKERKGVNDEQMNRERLENRNEMKSVMSQSLYNQKRRKEKTKSQQRLVVWRSGRELVVGQKVGHYRLDWRKWREEEKVEEKQDRASVNRNNNKTSTSTTSNNKEQSGRWVISFHHHPHPQTSCPNGLGKFMWSFSLSLFFNYYAKYYACYYH